MFDQTHVSQHPLVLHKLTLLRSRVTEPKKFRQLLREVSRLLLYEATRDLEMAPLDVQTPLGDCLSYEVIEQVALVPILRAGLGMSEAILDIIPTANVWHVGVYRNEKTLEPILYYQNQISLDGVDLVFVIDPMLATGGSAIAAIDIIRQKSTTCRIKFLGLIAAPEGLFALTQAHPDVAIHLAAIDSHLDEDGYIVPGLGDAGDREFATE
ncbi:MAG: uracil phosphoribosyltransferase [Chloroflexaceae bacterium]|nr:uracil phosphoribosyltransferase [Chloroflexaceae bacterium]